MLNAIGSTSVVLMLVFGRAWLFALGALSICVPSLVSIALSHSSTGFLGFREGGYDADALIIVVAELAAAAAQRIAGRAPGRRLFADEGCDRCHSIAAVGAGGKLGPRLDRSTTTSRTSRRASPTGATTPPRAMLMPGDYAERLDDREIAALAAFVAAASGAEAGDEDEDDDSVRGRNRGPGRSGRG